MDGFQVLLDAPDTPATRVQVATLGEFSDARYGEFGIGRDDVDAWARNLPHLPGGRALIDADHKADRKPRDSRAYGWITGVALDGDTPVAEVDWTPRGEQAIRDKDYLFLSPTYGDFTDEHGQVHENTLTGASLTNKPFLTSMPVLTLASAERLGEAADLDHAEASRRLLDALSAKQRDDLADSDFAIPSQRAYPIHDLAHARSALARVAQHGSPAEQTQVKAAVGRRYPQLTAQSDSPRQMDAAPLLKLLDLPEDATDETARDRVAALKADAEKGAETPAEPVETKTLDQQAAEAGKQLLDADEVKALKLDAAAGRTAMDQLKEQRFETTFARALNDPAGARVAPAERDSLHHFYTLDADATIKLIDEREPLVHAKPKGSAVVQLDDSDPQQVAAAGLHPDSHALDAKVKAKLRELQKPMSDYAVALEQVLADEQAA